MPVPTSVPPHDPLYQFHVAPAPNEPPLTVSVVVLPAHIDGELADADVGAVEFPPALVSSNSMIVFTFAVKAVPSKNAPPPGSVVGKSALLV